MTRFFPLLLFFVSGFCGLLYQVVWLRLAFRSFGVITPVLSVVISVFMLGLAIGSWAGGKWILPLCKKTGRSPLFYYAIAELLIGIGAFAIPGLYELSEHHLLGFGEMNSLAYLAWSALLITVTILPWCVFMGVTFPFMMAYIKGVDRTENKSFSFLYLSNVVGAMCGTLVTALLLIETFGFKSTLLIAGLANFSIAALAFILNKVQPIEKSDIEEEVRLEEKPQSSLASGSTLVIVILFVTGFSSMGLEVVWTRAFTPVLKTTVYAFASLISVYLFATWVGSYIYRRDITGEKIRSSASLCALLAVFAFLPIVINDPRLSSNKFILLSSIFPFCAVLGYLTPKLIDRYSDGFPKRAGLAYAINIVGCILGPLVASYILLPHLGTKHSMVLLSIPFIVFLLIQIKRLQPTIRYAFTVVSLLLFISSLFYNISYEERFEELDFAGKGEVRRDHTATVVSYGKGMEKRLYVNGIGITKLSVITKMMAHWPLAFLDHEPSSALVICFGMGTTYRSLLSWPINAKAVELVPSVKDAFPYYYNDAHELLNSPRGRVIIDDGRRFLKRTREKFDVITIDPPPPIEAAGSSFLYSRDFLDIVKERLAQGGILQHWYPGGDEAVLRSVIITLMDAFPYVKGYISLEGGGVHFLASMSPLKELTADEIVAKIPESALKDMTEWNPWLGPKVMINDMLKHEESGAGILAVLTPGDDVMITDDRPINEYYLLRRTFKE